jgi:hypothetical protein
MEDNTKLAMAIMAVNFVIALVVMAWCNKRIKDMTDPKNWKK